MVKDVFKTCLIVSNDQTDDYYHKIFPQDINFEKNTEVYIGDYKCRIDEVFLEIDESGFIKLIIIKFCQSFKAEKENFDTTYKQYMNELGFQDGWNP